MIEVKDGCSLEEYWRIEESTEYKNEFIDGQVISRIGTPITHVETVQNVAFTLHGDHSRADGWEMLIGMRMKVEHAGAYVWPDIVFYTLPGRFERRIPGDESLIDPLMIIEVFIPETERLDHGTKWTHYQTIPTLQEYVLIAANRVSVERYVRESGGWTYSAQTDSGGALELACIGCTLPMNVIYDRYEARKTLRRSRE